MSRVCFSIGHHDAPASLYGPLMEMVERYIMVYGVNCFVVGQQGMFDYLVSRCVLEAKGRHSEVTLLLLLPYHPAMRPIAAPCGFDGTFYPSGLEHVPPRFAIARANRRMIDLCNDLIAYVRFTPSNSQRILDYAHRKKECIHIENLADKVYQSEKGLANN